MTVQEAITYLKMDPIVQWGKQGAWKIECFTISRSEASLVNLKMAINGHGARGVSPGEYVKLTRGGCTVMSNTPAELRDHIEIVRQARGHVFIGGLGLGIVARACAAKADVDRVTIMEIDLDVITLVGIPLMKDSPKIRIMRGDVLDYKPRREDGYDVAWFDIWDDINTDNLPDMARLHRRWTHYVGWYGSWGQRDAQRIQRRANYY